MRYKATFVIGFGAGYVLGARAGRDRYEALARGARRVMENPTVQGAAGVLQAQAAGMVDDARRAVTGTVSQKLGSHRTPSVPTHNGHSVPS
jgi:hypothetical protein